MIPKDDTVNENFVVSDSEQIIIPNKGMHWVDLCDIHLFHVDTFSLFTFLVVVVVILRYAH